MLPLCCSRDWRDNYFADAESRLVHDGPRTKMLEAWSSGFDDNRFFCQINLALRPDSSLWVVPGSRSRREDTAAETRRFPDQPRPLRLLSRLIEQAAAQLWHCGCYDPAQPRATLHDIVDTPECT